MFLRARAFVLAAVVAVALSFAWTESSQAQWPGYPLVTPPYASYSATPYSYAYTYATPRVYYPPVVTPWGYTPPIVYPTVTTPAPVYQYWVHPYPNGTYRYAYRWWWN